MARRPKPEKGARTKKSNGSEEVEERTELSSEEKVALFEAYEEAVNELEEVRQALAEAEEKVSEAVKDIAEQVGSGPFRWQGMALTPNSRKKRGTDERNYYMESFNVELTEIG